MLYYSLILNVLLVIAVVILYLLLQKTKTRLKSVFLRSFGLELKLMEIYAKTKDGEVQKEIKQIFNSIKPLD